MVDEKRTRIIQEKIRVKSALRIISEEMLKHETDEAGRIDWAIEEILNAIENSPNKSAICVIDDFRNKMEEYMGYNDRAYTAFYIPFIIAERYSDLYYAGII